MGKNSRQTVLQNIQASFLKKAFAALLMMFIGAAMLSSHAYAAEITIPLFIDREKPTSTTDDKDFTNITEPVGIYYFLNGNNMPISDPEAVVSAKVFVKRGPGYEELTSSGLNGSYSIRGTFENTAILSGSAIKAGEQYYVEVTINDKQTSEVKLQVDRIREACQYSGSTENASNATVALSRQLEKLSYNGDGICEEFDIEAEPFLPPVGILTAGSETNPIQVGRAIPVSNISYQAGESAGFDTDTGDEDFRPDCDITGLGWIICPLIYLITGVNDTAYTIAEQSLRFEIQDAFNTDLPIYQVWDNIRNLANILFVIAFFIVILSQATNLGISNYGIKKMLPRVIIAAILLNLSYYLCIFALDLSNVIGSGIDGVFLEAIKGVNGDPRANPSWENALTTILGIGALTAGAVAGAVIGPVALLLLMVPLALAALLAIFTAIIILVVRQALIIILICIAPIAFAAYILPNTEKWFDKWKDAFIAMMIFYPLVTILFAGSKLAANILVSTSGSDGTGDNGILLQISALVILTLPLFAVPFLLRVSGGVLNRVGGFVNNPNRGPVDWLKKRAEEERGIRTKDRGAEAVEKGKRFHPAAIAARRRDMTARRKARADGTYSSVMAEDFAKRALDENRPFGEKPPAILQGFNKTYAEKIAGSAGSVNTVRSQAASQLAKIEAEERDEEDKLLLNLMRSKNMNMSSLKSEVSTFLSTGNGGSLGLTQQSPMLAAALERLSSAGEISVLEQARMSSAVDQGGLSGSFTRHEGTLKGKGGYHLATDFSLANTAVSRMEQARVNAAGGAKAGEFLSGKTAVVKDIAESMVERGVSPSEASRQVIVNNIREIYSDPTLRAEMGDKAPHILRIAQNLNEKHGANITIPDEILVAAGQAPSQPAQQPSSGGSFASQASAAAQPKSAPAPAPPPTPRTPAGEQGSFEVDAQGRQSPPNMTPEQRERYHDRFGGN